MDKVDEEAQQTVAQKYYIDTAFKYGSLAKMLETTFQEYREHLDEEKQNQIEELIEHSNEFFNDEEGFREDVYEDIESTTDTDWLVNNGEELEEKADEIIEVHDEIYDQLSTDPEINQEDMTYFINQTVTQIKQEFGYDEDEFENIIDQIVAQVGELDYVDTEEFREFRDNVYEGFAHLGRQNQEILNQLEERDLLTSTVLEVYDIQVAELINAYRDGEGDLSDIEDALENLEDQIDDYGVLEDVIEKMAEVVAEGTDRLDEVLEELEGKVFVEESDLEEINDRLEDLLEEGPDSLTDPEREKAEEITNKEYFG